MALTKAQKHIILGSGKLFLMDWKNEYATTLPADADIEKDEQRILVKNGATITYSTEKTTVKDDFSIASRSYTSTEEGKFTTGIACASPDMMPYLTGTATVEDITDPTSGEVTGKIAKFGGAGNDTGKTYLAMAMAITAFKNNEVERIILTRPAIEAGEKLGFLPGDLQSKVDPYLRPLYDALYQIMGADAFLKNMEKGLIEVAPLAYMRGRTLDNAYIILDEAQNTTPAQMKMFLTRIGFGSKVVITGDASQKDLPSGQKSGLDVAMKVLSKIDDIAICNLTSKDVVRHPLVQKIVKAYDDYESKQANRENNGNRENNHNRDKRFKRQ